MSTDGGTTRRWLIPVGLTVLVVGLVVIALTRGPVELNPDSPEGTVQGYLIAVHDGRWEDAVAFIHPQWLGACGSDDLARTATTDFTAELGFSTGLGGGFVEERFNDIAAGGDFEQVRPASTTSVEVTISRGDDGALGSSWSEYVTFELLDEDDFWWISGDPWPYFVWQCGD